MGPTFLPAWRLGELTRRGEIDCLDLLERFIARVERLNPRLNAVVAQDFDRAVPHPVFWTQDKVKRPAS